MAQDPVLSADVARLMGNDDLLRSAFDAPMQETVDQALLERMGLAEPASVSAVPAKAAANDNPPIWRRWPWAAGGAIAASLALIMVMRTGTGGDAFSTALDTTPSMATARLEDGATLTPLLTFAAHDGRFCREFVESRPAGSETGIACRTKGSWVVEARIKGGAAPAVADGIATAAGEDATKLDAAYEALGASDPLSADAERALMAGGWAGR